MPKDIISFHDHPLSCDKEMNLFCLLCSRGRGEPCFTYHCTECQFSLHKDCVERFLNKPFQCGHFLKIFAPTKQENADHHCHFYREKLLFTFARCTLCNISMDLDLVIDPPPLTISQPKHHKHKLTILLRLVTYTCNACGLEGDRDPYVCLECNLMVHKNCIEDLPRVISINRHDHRISHTFHLGQGDWECGVCRKTVNWVYGAYICSRCPSYAVHSKCATREEVWDGIELEDVPEEEEEIEDPFEVINETDIIHFSHTRHILRFNENYITCNDDMRCGGCVLPINGDQCYKCVECDFSLHEACAKLPRKKRHLLHNHKLTLRVDYDETSTFRCEACGVSSNGFRYECYHDQRCKRGNIKYDVRCSSLSEPFHHDLHPHPLYWTLEGSKQCKACGTEIENPLRSKDGEYALCMTCATLPRKVKNRCDDHFLSLRQGVGNASGDVWCDICETKTDPNVCYYTCEECGVSLHINCVLGDFYYMKVGHVDPIDYLALEVFPNNGVTRPLCSGCEVRCKSPFVLRKTTEEYVRYFCSIECLCK